MKTTNAANKVIGIIGVGKMGTGIGSCLIDQGIELIMMGNKNKDGIKHLKDKGAIEANKLDEITSNCNVIILSLRNSDDVFEVCSRINSIKNISERGIVIIDTTTGLPSKCIEISKLLKLNGVEYIDCPVTRGPSDAYKGKLNSIVGGVTDNREIATEIVGLYSENIIYTDGVGSAQRLKLINNGLSMGVVALTAEIIAMSKTLNVDVNVLRELVKHGSVNSTMIQSFFEWFLGENDSALNFSIENASKDISSLKLCIVNNYIKTELLDAVDSVYARSKEKGDVYKTIPNIIEIYNK
ncbi:NAD(P)-dependent oxidoreductase [Klebsiella oxytoca]|uniref:NAD(P)-dependent oxidoreductase n=1 Tax=Klebsiella oxytoca TaxID=571 RepID=UPI0022463AD7|nr:NAD(P)-dependent oxidoreductase [Klebsiella oxytoca]MCW9547319.1 NAD(P)-dependent oxidoreductase [Klebsiella oxytoca]